VGGGRGASVVVVVSGTGSVVAVVVCTGGAVVAGADVTRGAVVTTPAWVVTGPPAGGAVVVEAAVDEVDEVDDGATVEVGPGCAVVGTGPTVVGVDWLATGWRDAVSSPVATSKSMALRASAASTYNPTLNR
jgi:hypothetical protein